MAAETSIEWTDRTWNPVRGCELVSPGCTNCYAMKTAHRFSGPGKPYEGLTKLGARGPLWTGRARPVPAALAEPLRWRKPQKVFVNSMSDLFHEDVPDEFIAAVFGVMAACPQHTFQVLTKRPERMARWFEYAVKRGQQGKVLFDEDPIDWRIRQWCHVAARRAGADLNADRHQNHGGPWPLPNVWLGVSVEDQRRADERIPHLLKVPAAVRFLSCEPLLGAVNLDEWFEQISHCGACGAENDPQEEDRCPTCGRTGTLIDTYGYARAERYRTGERHDPESAAGRADVDGTWPTIDWVIVGGESGPGARPFDLAWARSIVGQCRAAQVPVFVKQLGAAPLLMREPTGAPDDGGDIEPIALHSRKGGDPAEWPEDLRIREWPEVRHG